MLSIGALGSGQGGYYISLAQGDYYLEGGEPLGRWQGQGASVLGLTGVIEEKSFRNVFEGFSPMGERCLIQSAGLERHQSGWDLTFSAPKSVSTLWSQAGSVMQDAIEKAQRMAVDKALSFIEHELSFSRRGKGGKSHEDVGTVVAAFDHGTSRALDPQLHTHCLVLNIGVRDDGTTGSLVSRPLYENKMLLGAIYRSELALQLENLASLTSIPHANTFEIIGVPKQLCNEFSKRREAIEKVLEGTDNASAVASAWAALQTRSAKPHSNRGELFDFWQKTGQEFGFGENEIFHLQRHCGERMDRFEQEGAEQEAISQAVAKLTERGTPFSKYDLVRETLYLAPGQGFGVDEVQKSIAKNLDWYKDENKGINKTYVEHEGNKKLSPTAYNDKQELFDELNSTYSETSSLLESKRNAWEQEFDLTR